MLNDIPQFCSDCAHNQVCKMTEFLANHEKTMKSIGTTTDYRSAPIQIHCQYKDTRQLLTSREMDYIREVLDFYAGCAEEYVSYDEVMELQERNLKIKQILGFYCEKSDS